MAETEGPVRLSRRNKEVAVIISVIARPIPRRRLAVRIDEPFPPQNLKSEIKKIPVFVYAKTGTETLIDLYANLIRATGYFHSMILD